MAPFEASSSAASGAIVVPNGDDPMSSHRSKTDRITALQDGIDGLSLAMFEALRGLRDAVAPESGNLGGTPNDGVGGVSGGSNVQSNPMNSPGENDFDEFLQSYRNGDPETLAMVRKVTATPPQRADELRRIHARIEMDRDLELVKKLATTVLEKSADIDVRVSSIPGMHRTRAQQMEYIKVLLERNRKAAERLDETYQRAEGRRDLVRKFVKDHTGEALGIVED